MMKKKKWIVICTAMMLMAPGVRAQKQWSLEDCIQYALDHNIKIKRQELAAKTSSNNYMQSKTNLLPEVGAAYYQNFNYGRTVDPTTYDFVNQNYKSQSMGASADLTLFNGLQNYNNIQKRHFDLMTDLQQLEKVKDDITLNIATDYLQILLNQELLEVAKAQYDVTQLQVDKTKKLVDVGNKALGDLLQIQAQAASDKLEVTNAQNDVKVSYLALTQLLDLDSAGGFEIVPPQTPQLNEGAVLQNVDDVYSFAEKEMPEIKVAEYKLKSAEKQLAMARGVRSPSLTLSAQAYTYFSELQEEYYSHNEQLKNNLSKTITLGISIPIFSKFETQRDISNAKIARNDAELQLRETQLDLYKTIQQAHSDAVSALDKYKSALEAVKSNEEAFKYTEQKFGVGLVSVVEYNEGKKNLTKARSDLAQAKYEYIFKTKILDFYMGNKIQL